MKTWAERIEEARARGSFTAEDVQLAGSWKTCAVGEMHGYDMARVSLWFVSPFVRRLGGHEGVEFTIAVETGDFERASRALEKIRAIFGEPTDESLIAQTVESMKESVSQELVEA